MQVNLNEEIADHLTRVKDLANEAADDDGESYSSRASAMRAMTDILRDLTKSQEEIINMERLMRFEQVTIELLKKKLDQKSFDAFIYTLENTLRA